MLRRIGLVATLFALAPALPALAVSATVEQILAKPSYYDGSHVVVSGTVENLERKVSQKGNQYVTFSLCSNQCIQVFGFGSPKIGDGQTITVFGIFATVKHVGGYTFNNAIQADYDSL
jgi:hypothetical protein